MGISPPALDGVAFQHFKEQTCATARAMHFFPRDPIARAHGLAFLTPAFADADATERSPGEAIVVPRKLKVCPWLRWPVVDTESQIFIDAVWLDNLAWIHFPFWIPNRFEFPERAHQLVAEHFGQQFSPRLSVSVFA